MPSLVRRDGRIVNSDHPNRTTQFGDPLRQKICDVMCRGGLGVHGNARSLNSAPPIKQPPIDFAIGRISVWYRTRTDREDFDRALRRHFPVELMTNLKRLD